MLQNSFVYSFGGPIGAFLPNVNLTDTSFAFSGFSLTFFYIQNFRDDGLPFTSDVVSFMPSSRPEMSCSSQIQFERYPSPIPSFC